MILVLPPDCSPDLPGSICRKAEALGWRCEVSRGDEQLVVALAGTGSAHELQDALARHPEVEVLPILSGREYWRIRSRRRFMTAMVGGLGALTAVGVTIPIVGFLLPPRRPLNEPALQRAASVGQIPANSAKVIRFRGQPLLLVHREGDRFYALSAVCTHMGVCQLDWDPDRRQLVCPCHGGAFDVHGNVVQGPPSVPLPTYEVERLGDTLYIRREV